MKINSINVNNTDLSECLSHKIKIVGESNRRGSHLFPDAYEKCCGFNINKYIYDGMSVNEYQMMIKQRFNSEDPQFSLTKHLRYDIRKGFLELVL